MSDQGARVFLYPDEESEPVGFLADGNVIYFKP